MTKDSVLQVVDISKDDLETAEQLVKAASTLGFVMVEGSGFSQKKLTELLNWYVKDSVFTLISLSI